MDPAAADPASWNWLCSCWPSSRSASSFSRCATLYGRSETGRRRTLQRTCGSGSAAGCRGSSSPPPAAQRRSGTRRGRRRVLLRARRGRLRDRDRSDHGLLHGQPGRTPCIVGWASPTRRRGPGCRVRSVDAHCHRSVDAYPILVARALGGVADSGDPPLAQSEPAASPTGCGSSSAPARGRCRRTSTTGWSVAGRPRSTAEPRTDVDLVTITIGGNDAIFSDVVQAACSTTTASTTRSGPGQLDRSRPTIEYPDSQALDLWAKAAIERIQPNLLRVHENIRRIQPSSARSSSSATPTCSTTTIRGSHAPDPDCFTVMDRISQTERRGSAS